MDKKVIITTWVDTSKVEIVCKHLNLRLLFRLGCDHYVLGENWVL